MLMIYRCVCYPRANQWDSVNLDIDDANILFHVSIRPDRGALILTDMIDGAWGIERILPLDPPVPQILPLTLLAEPGRVHLLRDGVWQATMALRRPHGPGLRLRTSMPAFATPAFGPFVPGSGAAWLPEEGIGATALHGFLDAPGWAGGPAVLQVGAASFDAEAEPAPSAEGLPQAFRLPLPAAAQAAIARAAAETRQPTAIVVTFAQGAQARGWVNAPGVVESFAEGHITGWLRTRGALPRLEVLADGVVVPVTGHLAGEPRLPGDSLLAAADRLARESEDDGYAPWRRIAFSLDLPAALRAGAGVIELLGNGALLAGGILPLTAPAPLAPPAPEAAAEETPPAVTLDGFVLRGEVTGTAPPALGLRCQGAPLDVAIACWPLAPDRHGFAIELPGTIWQCPGAAEGVALEVTLAGAVLPPGPLRLTRDMALAALARAAAGGDATQAAQAEALLAAEHLAFGRFLRELPAEAAGPLRDFAQKMKLAGFLQREDPPEGPGLPVPLPPAEDPTRLAVWGALRALSAAMPADDAPLMDLALNVAAAHGLEGAAREHFWFSLVPNLATTDELPRLAEAVPLATWYGHENHNDAWALSSAVALLAAGSEARRATEALYRLAGSPGGWINTACVGFALRRMEALTMEGAAPASELERFRYAVLGLLDAFKGEWFSRLHDRHLVQAMVLLLSRRPAVPDYLAQDMVKAALRHYGLAPAFWRAWARSPAIRAEPPNSLLRQALARFRTLQVAMAAPEQVDAQLGRLQAATHFFRTHRNPEALVWQRELAAHAMRPGSAAAPAAVARLVAELAAADAREAVRVLAHPGTPPPGGLATFGIDAKGVRDLLREMRPQPRGMADGAQRAFCAALAAAAPGSADRAVELAELLADPRHDLVGLDMLSLLAARADPAGTVVVDLLGRFGAAMLRALPASAGSVPPAPLLAGLARFARLALLPGHRRPACLPEVLDVLHEAFAERYGAPPDLGPATTMPGGDPRALAGDVLVCVYSCNKYLDSRVAAIRETWMRDLAAVGARCIVVVGDGDDMLHGDVLRLAVSDAYEDLPAKTLRMVDWVAANTDAQILIKIDDDCALSTANYFGSFDYRAHHYYGRLLERPVGGMDRVWHHLKSSSARARSIDRSPEPSTYCDGGGVYALSRHAMQRLGAAARSEAGQGLIARSFMEDKLVGDLLALEGIAPANTDYESYQRRRTFGTAHPIGIYENTFFPSALAPAKVAHLDREADQAVAAALAGQAELQPKRLWPSFTAVGTDYHAHQLELLSAGDVLARAQAEPFGVVLAARNEMTMLPHLLAHYRALGVRAFYAVDNASDDGSREWLLAQPDVVVYSAASEYRTSHYGVTWQQTVLAHHFLGRWAVVADADEFLIYPGWRSRKLGAFIAGVMAEGADAVPLWMADMYPFGSLEEADFTAQDPFAAAPFLDRLPVTPSRLTSCYYSNRVQQVSALRHRLLPQSEPNSFVAEKVAMFRYHPGVRLSEGLHSAANLTVWRRHAVFAHFKYHAGFRRKILEEIARGQHYNGAAEYRRYAAMLAEGSGGFGEAGLSVELGADGFLTPVSNVSF